MPVDAEGRWRPDIFPKQATLINIAKNGKKRFVLASGPRLSGKTLGCLHTICDHAYSTNPANVAVVSFTQSAGYDSGVWTDLTELIIPEWVAGDFGMEWVRKPAIASVSKKPYCSVSNYLGRPVKFQLESLKNEEEVEQRFKSKRYSCMFVNELSNFKKVKTLMTWKECLRMVGLPDNKHLFLADTNPADDGEKSWIYKLFFLLPRIDFSKVQDDYTAEQSEVLKKLQPLIDVLEFSVLDNTFVSAERVDELKATYASDPDLYARYIHGAWVTSSVDALFVNVFKPAIHVVGEIETPGNPNPSIMVPQDECMEMYTGWDLGVINSAATIIEKVNPDENGYPSFKVLDELVIVGEDHSMTEFVLEFVKKMKFWQEVMKKPVRWIHYSDRSAFDLKDAQVNLLHHQIVWNASPEDTPGGRIQLIAAARGRDSVRQRIDLTRKLLWENRLFVNNNFCPDAITMFKSIRKGTSLLHAIERGSPHKHVFDAMTYAIASESVNEMSEMIMSQMRMQRKLDESGIVTIGL